MMMNRKMLNFLLYFLILNTSILAQTNSQNAIAKVSYAVQIHLDKDKEIYKIHQEFSPGLVASAELVDSEVNYFLVFSDSSSTFYIEKKLYSDNRAASFVIRNARYYGKIKQQSNNFITEELQEDFGKFLVSRPYQKWEFHDETKKIGDYLCFKATTYHTVTSPQGKVFKYDFTAWYSPQLPYKFGPAGYGNLPGLIIELQGDSFTYGVTKIDFYENLQNEEIEMPKLKKLKLISEEEFEALAAEDEKRRQKRN
jgi:GLPGLI family protein